MKPISKIIAFSLIIFGCSDGSHYYKENMSYRDSNIQEYDRAESHEEFNTEEYDRIYENNFLNVIKNPLSTFSIDVDAASYSNARRYITQGNLPPKNAVRIEEFVNYFNYDYKQPQDEHPFSITTEVSDCPWNDTIKLLHIGIQGKQVELENLPNTNLIFLLDVSGSMESPDKLPLLKSSFHMLLDQLGEKDRIAVVTYAGNAGLVLPSTSCDNKDQILEAINNLEAGGSTAGGEGIELAYKIAEENLIKGGNNRIILATDGDFNVGVSSDAELVRLIEDKRDNGVYLSVLGFGTGNIKDSKMEKLADNGNGNYYYIDNLFEAKKVLVSEIGGTLLTIAKDVKIQLEFNPAKVKEYRLIGYENRMLESEDFEDDKKDAGELGAGHSVTAIYEIVENNGENTSNDKTNYKYVSTQINPDAYNSVDLATLRFRYKNPDDTTSNLIEETVLDRHLPADSASMNFNFSAAVAEFALLLRDSKYKGTANYDQVVELAMKSKGEDPEGYRSEFIRLVKAAKDMKRSDF